MTKLEKMELEKRKTVAYWSELGGVEVKYIENGIEDYIVCVVNAWGGKRSYHRVKVNYSGERAYIVIKGIRLYLDQCIRNW